jgi:23S rRNA G2069 N7-methylase RlmK/C1962 C5-methylase RlmI
MTMDTHSKYFRLRRKDIAYFKFIIESYEGMAVVRTKDPGEAVVELMIAPGWEQDVEEILEALRQEIPIEPLSEG